VHYKLTCRISWLAAEIMSFNAAGGIFKPSLNTMDIIGPYKHQKNFSQKQRHIDSCTLCHHICTWWQW